MGDAPCGCRGAGSAASGPAELLERLAPADDESRCEEIVRTILGYLGVAGG